MGAAGSASAGGSGAALIQNGVAIGQGTGTAQAGPGMLFPQFIILRI